MKSNQFKLPVLAIIIRKKGNTREVLLIQRYNPKKKYSHLKWAFPGGQIEFGEHPSETVVREVKEEAGVVIKPVLDALFVQNHVYVTEKIHVLALCYPAKYVSGKVTATKDQGTSDARWFNIKKINYDECLPQEEQILKKALKHL